jgi:hypothetical protein
MKNLAKAFMLIVFAVGLTCMSTSCKKDSGCYDCTGFDDGTISVDDLGEVCVGSDDGQGGTFTDESLEEMVTIYEAFGGTCKKK